MKLRNYSILVSLLLVAATLFGAPVFSSEIIENQVIENQIIDGKYLRNVRIVNSEIRNSEIVNAEVLGSYVYSSTLTNVNAKDTYIEDSSGTNLNMMHGDVVRSEFTNSHLSHVSMTDTVLDRANAQDFEAQNLVLGTETSYRHGVITQASDGGSETSAETIAQTNEQNLVSEQTPMLNVIYVGALALFPPSVLCLVWSPEINSYYNQCTIG